MKALEKNHQRMNSWEFLDLRNEVLHRFEPDETKDKDYESKALEKKRHQQSNRVEFCDLRKNIASI